MENDPCIDDKDDNLRSKTGVFPVRYIQWAGTLYSTSSDSSINNS